MKRRGLLVAAGVAAAGAAVAAGSGCITGGAGRGPAHPLYAGPRADVDDVATLYGPIATVDGQDVSALGRRFELRAGCHVVTTKVDYMDQDPSPREGAWLGRVPPATFVLHMQARHAYIIDRRMASFDSGSSTVRLVAHQVNASGKTTAEIAPMRFEREARNCIVRNTPSPAPLADPASETETEAETERENEAKPTTGTDRDAGAGASSDADAVAGRDASVRDGA